MKCFSFLSIFIALSLLVGCAGSTPLPGGKKKTNESYYASKKDFLNVVATLESGMSLKTVLKKLGREEEELVHLNRHDILAALYGRVSMDSGASFQDQEVARIFLQSLSGYRLDYRYVEKEYGFVSPIRLRTNEAGYSYSVTMIFQNGVLFDMPVLSGGRRNNVSSKTVFDYLNPGALINSQMPY